MELYKGLPVIEFSSGLVIVKLATRSYDDDDDNDDDDLYLSKQHETL